MEEQPTSLTTHTTELKTLMRAVREGKEAALGELYERLYPQLHKLAHLRLRRVASGGALNTTALVHESFERFADADQLSLNDKAHFMAYASRVMRSIIVDYAREQFAQRRGGGAAHVELSTTLFEQIGTDEPPEVMRVHEALQELSQIDERLAKVVEMRYFGGLENSEIAEALNVSSRTVERDWEKARAYLYEILKH